MEKLALKQQALVGRVLGDYQLLSEYRKDPDKILGRELDKLKVSQPEQQRVAAGAKAQIDETDRVFPGLSHQEATSILLGSLGAPAMSFQVFTWLNVVLFVLGIALLIVGTTVGVVKGQEQFSVIFGSGGLLTIAIVFVTNPLQRIANAASDQSQIRTAVMAFWIQLANWRTEVLQPNEKLEPATVERVNRDVRTAMSLTMSLLQKYSENTLQAIPDAGVSRTTDTKEATPAQQAPPAQQNDGGLEAIPVQ